MFLLIRTWTEHLAHAGLDQNWVVLHALIYVRPDSDLRKSVLGLCPGLFL